MGLQDLIKSDRTGVFLGTGTPGVESITYHSGTHGNLTFNAEVNRNPAEYDVDEGAHFVLLNVANTSTHTDGVESIDVNADTVTLPVTVGGADITLAVREIVEQNEHWWRLRLA